MDAAEKTVSLSSIATALARSKDFLAVGDDRGQVAIYPVFGEVPLWTSDATKASHRDAIHTLSWSPDGSKIASGGMDNIVKVWDTATGHVVSNYEGHKFAVTDLTWSPDGSMIASASNDATIQIWKVSGEQVGALELANYVTAVAWSPQARLLASGEGDGRIVLWSEKGEKVGEYPGHAEGRREAPGGLAPFEISSIAFSPNGRFVASAQTDDGGNGGHVHVWDLAAYQATTVYPQDPVGVGWVHGSLSWLNDMYLFSAGMDDTAYVLKVFEGGQPILRSIPYKLGSGFAVCLLPGYGCAVAPADRPCIDYHHFLL